VVDSPASGGTIFTLCFPAIGAAIPEPDQPAASGRETVLLVEDEDAVRVVIGALLRRHGYQVIEAATPQGALEIFPHHADAIDLLLTDIVMPDMNGPALAQRLVSTKPGLRILFISGYADAAKSALSGPHISFLAKPFHATALTRAVRELLDRPAQKAPS
jgi:CheY-like chemotaxis protein